MSFSKLIPAAALAATWIAGALPATAQLTSAAPDPLARIQAAAAANTEACSTQEVSPCAQAAPKIIAAAQSSTTLHTNLRRLTNEIGARVTGSLQMARAVGWAMAAFREAGVGDAQTEVVINKSFPWLPALLPTEPIPSSTRRIVIDENVVAEIRGRERPGEFVLLGAHLDSWNVGAGALDAGCNAALVIEAARIIHLTGLRPRRSIRFVLFTGAEQGGLGSWSYVRAHRAEFDNATAAIFFDRGCGRVTGFSFGGRRDIEPGVREALAFLGSGETFRHTTDAFLDVDNLDFLLEGVPALLANQEDAGYLANRHTAADTYDQVDLETLKHNTAVAGVLAFGLAESPAPLGRRLSRAEIEALLEETGLTSQMKVTNLWELWRTGKRGREP